MLKVMRIFIYCFHVKNQKVKVRMTKLFKIWQLIVLATLRPKKRSQERTQEDEKKKPKKRKRDPQISLLLSLILPLYR
jgi:hypothetical protein